MHKCIVLCLMTTDDGQARAQHRGSSAHPGQEESAARDLVHPQQKGMC